MTGDLTGFFRDLGEVEDTMIRQSLGLGQIIPQKYVFFLLQFMNHRIVIDKWEGILSIIGFIDRFALSLGTQWTNVTSPVAACIYAYSEEF